MPDATPANRVLVVDDDAGLLRLIEKALKREGFAATILSSGRDATAWLAKNTTDLMLLDLKLQDTEGEELVNQLLAVGRSLPFIIITGQGDERVAVEMMRRGALDYLVKDIEFIEFLPIVVRRALAQVENTRCLAPGEKRARELQMEILEIAEKEQRRIGHDLHDGLGQQLTAIELMCHSLREDLAALPSLEKQAAKMGEFLRETIAQTRSMSRGLSPVRSEPTGLVEALEELATNTRSMGKIRCRIHCLPPVLIEESMVAGHLYRIAQEAVNNALKHGHPSAIIIELSRDNDAVRLRVSDDGQGFSRSRKAGACMGLDVMKHRAAIAGGMLVIESKQGKGVTVNCTVPCKYA